MPSHPGKHLCDDAMQMRIKQVTDAGLDTGCGTLDIADVGTGTFQVNVEGHGDYILITAHGDWGTIHRGVALTETPCHYGGTRKWFICPSCRRRCGVLYSLVSVTGSVPKGAMKEVQYIVRSRILDLTMEMERRIPAAVDVKIGSMRDLPIADASQVAQITQQVFQGPVYNAPVGTATSIGDNSQVAINVVAGDRASLLDALAEAGVAKDDAGELVEIAANEAPKDGEQGIGAKAKAWLAKKIGQSTSEIWGMAKPAAQKLITEALMKYYGLK